MRIAIIAHSLAHPRQKIFFNHLGTLQDVELLKIGPLSWGALKNAEGFPVTFEGNLANYEFGDDAEKTIADFKPDVIYCQAEWWSKEANRCARFAQKIGCKFVLFVWENMKTPTQDWYKETIKLSDLVICGNNKAREIVTTVGCNTCKLPQVGIDTELFKPMENVPKDWNLIFVGRPVAEKGINIIQRITKKQNITLELISGVPYEKLPRFYNRGQVFILFSYSVPWWTEQFAPYSSLEALSCGVPVITSNSGAIPEWIGGWPGVVMLQEKDEFALEHTLKAIKWADRHPMLEAREIIVAKFSKEAVSIYLKEVLRKVAEGEIHKA